MSTESLKRIFNPKSIAVIGASNDETSVGYALFKNIKESKYKGKLYAINPNHAAVQGEKTYPSVSKINDKIDLIIIATPASTVESIVEECAKSGAGGAVIVSAGFNKTEKEGKERAERVLAISQKYGFRVLGPNCLGFLRPSLELNASFAIKNAKRGNIALISQSGALCTVFLDWAEEHNVGFNYFVSVGDMLDLGFHDLIDYFGNDPETKSILIYMESITNARKFMSAARAVARSKPIIVLKSGRSDAGSKAAASHTGSIAGNDLIFDAAFKRAGIIRVNTVEQLFDCAKALAMQRRPDGNRLAIITNAGGPGVLATDLLMKRGGETAKLSEKTFKKMDAFLPKTWSRANPIDIIGDADPERFRKAVEACADDENVDALLVILTPQSMTKPALVAKGMIVIDKKTQKTILAAFMGSEEVAEAKALLEKNNIPVYPTPEAAVKCFTNMHSYSRNLELLYETPASIPHAFTPDQKKARAIIDTAAKEKRENLTEIEAKRLLETYQIPTTRTTIAKTAKEAGASAEKIGFPLAMKIVSKDILHKTDIGGVKLDIQNKAEAEKAFDEIITAAKKKVPSAKIEGVLIERMEKKRYELLLGCKKDPLFGPAIVFGMGGVAVEVFKDTNVGLPPLNMALSMRLIEETKIFNLLKGYRGMPAVDINSIQFLLYKFAYLVMDFPEIKEIDINPFSVDENGGVVLDAKVVLDKEIVISKTKVEPHSHLVISPYPKEYIKTAKMNDGNSLILRPIRPEDEPMEEEMFKSMSEETQRFRFFTLIKDVTHELLIKYTQIDYDREIAIIAEVEEKGKKKMAGVVRLIGDPYNDNAEFAIVVADPWHGRGAGNLLTDYIIEIAKLRKLRKIYAYFLGDNNRMKYMFEKRGFAIKKEGDTYYAELKL